MSTTKVPTATPMARSGLIGHLLSTFIVTGLFTLGNRGYTRFQEESDYGLTPPPSSLTMGTVAQ
jgi:hypothetical protein